MTEQQPAISLYGAVDLSHVKNAPKPGSPSAAPGGAAPAGEQVEGPIVTEVTEATFNDTVQLSTVVPVVLELWSARAEASAQLGSALSALAREYGGRFQHARVEAESNPQIVAAFGVQGVPAVFAVVGGRPLPLFQGAPSAEEIRPVIEELLEAAVQLGATGVLSGGEPEEGAEPPAEPPLPPLHAEAHEALEREDYDAAARAYRKALAENPADAEAKAALAQVELFQRVSSADVAQTLSAAAAADPADVGAHLAAADAELAGGRVVEAFERLIATIRVTSGEDRDTARVRLLDYFEILGPEDPRVADARRKLASALY